MAAAELNVCFRLGVPLGSEDKKIQKNFEPSPTLAIVFKIGLPPAEQKSMVLKHGAAYDLEIKFSVGLPNGIVKKQISKYFTIADGLTVYFNLGLSSTAEKFGIWKFTKWTIDGPFDEKYYMIRTIEKPFLTVEPLPILPRLRGQAYPDKKRPDYHTIVKQSPSAIAKIYESWHYPRWYIELTYEFMAGNAPGSDYRKLLDFFIARRGSLSDFWYQDPEDNAAQDELIGTGDGSQRSYQLCRTYCGYQEPIFGLNADYPLKLTVDKALQTPDKFTVSNTGLLTFKTATPPKGAEIRASFHFFYRCRFTEDMAEFEQFAAKLWTLKSLSMVTTL